MNGPAMQRVIEAISSRGETPTPTPRGFLVRCPAHNDNTPSLNIDQGYRGVVMQCRSAQCSTTSIVEALGLKADDLFDDQRHAPMKEKGDGWPSREDAVRYLQNREHPVATELYEYLDAQGLLAFTVARLDLKGGKKKIQPIIRRGERWSLKGMEGMRPLFRLPQILAADPRAQVLVVEGERKVLLLEQLGFVATYSSHGAASASKTDWSALKGREVVILPDNDAAGERYARDVRLLVSDKATTVRIVRLPGLKTGEDVVDWAKTRKAADAARELDELIAQASPEVVPSPSQERQPHDYHDCSPEDCMGEVEQPEPVPGSWRSISIDELVERPPIQWLVPDLLPRGGTCVLASEPGSGKSLLMLDLAQRLTCGQPEWLGKPLRHHGPVAYVALEGLSGLPGRGVAWRRANPMTARKHAFHIVEWSGDALLGSGLDEFVASVRAFHARAGGLAMLIVDTLTLATSGDENDSSTNGPMLRVLSALATEMQCCVVLLHHLRKQDQNSRHSRKRYTLHDVRGSGALVGNTDAVLCLDYQQGREARCLHALKMKDGNGSTEAWFRLDPQVTGRVNEDGTDEVSCVVVPVEAPAVQDDDRGDEKATGLLARLERKRPALIAKMKQVMLDHPGGVQRTHLKVKLAVNAQLAQVFVDELLLNGELVPVKKGNREFLQLAASTAQPSFQSFQSVLERSSGMEQSGTERSIPVGGYGGDARARPVGTDRPTPVLLQEETA